MDQMPFTFAGRCDDEVTMTFDDTDKELFVSRNFLSLVSPVFNAMFSSDFKEKKTGVLEMKDKEYENVLKFLLILHPCVKRRVTGANVYVIMSMAEEYQIDTLIGECKYMLYKILNEKIKVIENAAETELIKTNAAHSCLIVLSTAVLYSHDELKQEALDTISRFGTDVFLKDEASTKLASGNDKCGPSRSVPGFSFGCLPSSRGRDRGGFFDQHSGMYNASPSTPFSFGHPTEQNTFALPNTGTVKVQSVVIDPNQYISFFGKNRFIDEFDSVVLARKECRESFKNLPDAVKLTLLQMRLNIFEDNKMHSSNKTK